MYYSYCQKKSDRASLIRVSLLALVISNFTFHPDIFADNLLNQTAEDYRSKGYEQQQKGNIKKALSYYSKALTLGSKSPVIYNDIGVLYEQLGITQKAEEFYSQAIKLNQNYLPPYTNLAYLYQDKGDLARSFFFFQERLKRAPNNDPWKEKILKELNNNPYYKQKVIEKETQRLNVELVRKTREEFNNQIIRCEKHYKQGELYLKEKKFKEALTEFERALALTPNNPKIIKAKQRALYEQKVEMVKRRTENAIKSLESGEVETAKEEFHKILTIIPNESIQKSE